MDWSTYYERFYGWSDSTQISRISSIDEFGDVSDEVAEIVQNLYDEKAATRLVRRALTHGVRFTASEIDEMIIYLDSIPDELLLTCKTAFTEDQLASISSYYHNDEILAGLAPKANADIHIDKLDVNVKHTKASVSHSMPKITLGQVLGAIAVGVFRGLFSSQNKKHKGRCNGDCANCPLHFGYRFGRWYYGHGHNYGCEYGGNRGGGNT